MRQSSLIALLSVASAAVTANGCDAIASKNYAGPPASDAGASLGDAGGAPVAPPPPRPDFGATVTASVPPPPISGGTLLVLADGKTAVAADPDRDALYVVDLTARALLSTVALQAGDEPGRLVQDAAGRVHVALRRGGALVTIDPGAGSVVARRPVCPAPRGVAYDAGHDAVWVACATGELVSLPAGGGTATSTLEVERDLRDVVFEGGAMAVTEFRSAQLLHVAVDGSIASRDAMPALVDSHVPHVAWRMVADTQGALVVAHQEESTLPVPTQQQGGYGAGGGDGGPDDSLVDSVVTFLASGSSVVLPDMVLPVDVAVSSDGKRAAVVAAGNAFLPGLLNMAVIEAGQVTSEAEVGDGAQATSVAFDGAGDIVVQTREPAALWILPPSAPPPASSITLSSTPRADTAHAIFHTLAGAAIACASCHPEGGDDGHVWLLDGERRRTPSLRGTIAGTAPYHWPGDMADLVALANDVYTVRMNGAALDPAQLRALGGWVEAIPAPPAPSWLDAAAVQRGQAIFQRADVGCASCHSGAKCTDNATVDVGTGGSFQVPPLVGVGWRTPLLHDGCAATLADRFGKCATAQHGSTGSLSAQDVSYLVAYLESL